MGQNLTRVSKYLSLVLRHAPEKAQIVLDNNGWVSVDSLLSALRRNNFSINMTELTQLVASNDKKRFAFNADKTLIRASQGHSVEVDLKLAVKQPPVRLYHGTVAESLISIKNAGLKKMSRQHVHLSADINTAIKVGGRRGEPIILTVDALSMFKDGFKFYQSDNGVWLTEEVPFKYITVKL